VQPNINKGFLLDANILRLILDGDTTVQRTLLTVPPQEVWLSSVAAEETIAGRLSNIQRARSGKGPLTMAQAHEDLAKTLVDLSAFQILPYSDAAESIFQSLSSKAKRIGSQDCRIAVQAIAEGMIVVTRNLSDFQAIGAPCIDWSLREGNRDARL
jgi:tRNA(fMet)-specific endonuclease VapC